MICSTTRRGHPQLVRSGRRRDEDRLRHALHELVEPQRPVVHRERQPEAVVDERLLARAVALVHPADLRHRLVRLVDHDEEVAREVVEQRERRLTRRAAVEHARVVLDAVAVAELLHHLEVVLGALAQAVRLEQLALLLELRDVPLELLADHGSGALDRRRRRHVVRGRVDRDLVLARVDLAAERVEVRDRLDLVAEQRDAVGRLRIRRLHLDDVAARAEAPAAEHHVVAAVLDVDEGPQQLVARVALAHPHGHQLLLVLARRAEAVDARDRGDDHDVAAAQERRGRRVAQPVDVLVARGVLLDVGVRGGQVRLGLVVVVVRDEVLDGVRREELPELVAELRGKRLVVGDHERRLLDCGDHVGHRERLAGGGRAEQRLVLPALVDAGRELRDRLRLVAGRLVALAETEETHVRSLGNRGGIPVRAADYRESPSSPG